MITERGDVAGAVCPSCAGYAAREPGGLRCLICGRTPLFRRILPRDHWLSGRDRVNRERQRALDRVFTHPGRAVEIVHEMLDRVRGRYPGDDEERA